MTNRSSTRYRAILKLIEQSPEPIKQQYLEETFIDGVCAWDVAQTMEGFIFDHVDSDMYERRAQLCGEEQDGF